VATIEFRSLSVLEAEEVLAEIWNCLEEYNLPSPHMTFEFGDVGSVSLGCRFGEPLWARLVAMRLWSWLVESERRAAVPGGRAEPVDRFSPLTGGPDLAPRGASHLAMASLRYVPFDRARS
jgi:hypothetical protein